MVLDERLHVGWLLGLKLNFRNFLNPSVVEFRIPNPCSCLGMFKNRVRLILGLSNLKGDEGQRYFERDLQAFLMDRIRSVNKTVDLNDLSASEQAFSETSIQIDNVLAEMLVYLSRRRTLCGRGSDDYIRKHYRTAKQFSAFKAFLIMHYVRQLSFSNDVYGEHPHILPPILRCEHAHVPAYRDLACAPRR